MAHVVNVIDRDFIDPIKNINLEQLNQNNTTDDNKNNDSDDEKYDTLRNALTKIKNTNIEIIKKTNI
jgi:hypothetical protein